MKFARITKLVLSLTAVLVAVVGFADAAAAQTASPAAPSLVRVSGTGAATSTTVFDSVTVGSRTITHAESTIMFNGGVSANGTELYTIVSQTNSVQFQGYGVFYGSIGRRTGTFAYHFTGSGSSAKQSGSIIFDSGTGQLAGLRGYLLWDQGGPTFNYHGAASFGSTASATLDWRTAHTGSNHGYGFAAVTAAGSQVCFGLTWSNLPTPTGADLELVGAPGTAKVTLFTGAPGPQASGGSAWGCRATAAPVAADVAQHPGRYQVTVRTAQYPSGAIAGQLQA